MTHDPLCRCHGEESPIPFCQSHAWCRCECDFIAQVRADERNKIFTSLDKMADSAHTDDCRDLTCGGCVELMESE